MGALVVVAALLWPLGPSVLFGSRIFNRLTDRLTADLGEGAAPLVYLALWVAALFAIFWAARLTDVGPEALVAFAISSLGVGLVRLLNGENVDID